MHARVVLTALQGLAPGQTFVFDTPGCCVLGRSNDCGLHIPNDAAHQSVSRHHCLLAVDPPHIWVRDLGSRNGTFVNAVDIGHRPPGPPVRAADAPPRMTCELEEGDAIQVGNVMLTVHVNQDADPIDSPPGCGVGLHAYRSPKHPQREEVLS